jgi:hypothetical protein
VDDVLGRRLAADGGVNVDLDGGSLSELQLTDTKPPWFFTIECDVADRARCPAA